MTLLNKFTKKKKHLCAILLPKKESKNDDIIINGELMRVMCPHCGHKATITSTQEHSDRVKDLYCSCTNTKDCGATFVTTLAFKNTLNPPISNTMEMAKNLVDIAEKIKPPEQGALEFS
jgi:ribosomal protein S27E